MDSILDIANIVLNTINESRTYLNSLLHLKEVNANEYVKRVLDAKLDGIFNRNDPSVYMKLNTKLAKCVGTYSMRTNDNGDKMDGFMDSKHNQITENDFKKDVKDLIKSNNYPFSNDNIFIDNLLNDFIDKVHKVQNGIDLN